SPPSPPGTALSMTGAGPESRGVTTWPASMGAGAGAWPESLPVTTGEGVCMVASGTAASGGTPGSAGVLLFGSPLQAASSAQLAAKDKKLSDFLIRVCPTEGLVPMQADMPVPPRV